MRDNRQLIKSIQNEIYRKEVEYQRVIKTLKDTLKILEDTNDVCLECGGTGKHFEWDYFGECTETKCWRCNGTGVKPAAIHK